MKKNILLVILFFIVSRSHAQEFINKGVIEYEVQTNIQKTIGSGTFEDMIKENLPKIKTGYYTLTFADNKSIFKFDHWSDQKIPAFLRSSDENNVWYYNFVDNSFNNQKNVWGSNFNIRDSIQDLKWRLTNESREIAGFNCRKAVTQIFDSVYVFAFYTDEILFQGGPCSIHGLPGTILGMTIPRLYTSWIATKVSVIDVDASSIKPVTSKKGYSRSEMDKILLERTIDYYSDGTDTSENNRQKMIFIWDALL